MKLRKEKSGNNEINNLNADFLFLVFSGGPNTVETHCVERGYRHWKCSNIVSEKHWSLGQHCGKECENTNRIGFFEHLNRQIMKLIIVGQIFYLLYTLYQLTNLQTLQTLQIYKLYKLTNCKIYKLTNLHTLRTYKLTNFQTTNLQTYKVCGTQIERLSVDLHSTS